MAKKSMSFSVTDQTKQAIMEEAEKMGFSYSRWIEYAIKTVLNRRTMVHRYPPCTVHLWGALTEIVEGMKNGDPSEVTQEKLDKLKVAILELESDS